MDLRLPIGGLFTIFGVILTVFGLMSASDTALYAKSLGYNINLYWGLALLAFGALMLIFAYFGKEPDFLEDVVEDKNPTF
jgi:membrane-bound ClpP family serine protease